MPNTLVYAVKQCISVFLISKYNIDSDFLMSYHNITTCHDIYRYIGSALIILAHLKVDLPNAMGSTSLHFACQYCQAGKPFSIIKLLQVSCDVIAM